MKRPLLGMEAFSKQVEPADGLPRFIYSDGVQGQRIRSTSHGGFDNDVATMNSLLRSVLGREPEYPFTDEILNY